jgi:glyoxylase-like metal-dependent hydrolase (beta-lactamase superfamily II)
MKVITSTLLGFTVAAAGWLTGWKTARAQANPPLRINFAAVKIATERVAPGFFTLTGSPGSDPGHWEAAGGRIGALIGADGILLVDASYAPLNGKIVAALKEISPAPIRFLVNTHEHPDHTGGDAEFARRGALIFAREETWLALNRAEPAAVRVIIGNATSFTDPQRLPVITYGMGAPVKVRLDDEIVDLIPLPASHTDGDTVVRFERADVMMIGDVYRNYGYPFVDAGHGGNFRGLIEALDLIIKLSGPNTKLIPGHGTVITRADIPPYENMITTLRDRVQQMIRAGDSLQVVLAAKLTAPYDAGVRGGLDPLHVVPGTSADRFVTALYTEVRERENEK